MTLNPSNSRSRDFSIKYLEYGERYDVGLKGGQIENCPWAFDWNPPSSRSLILHVKYFENGDRYDDGVNGSRIGNHPWAIDWHHDL